MGYKTINGYYYIEAGQTIVSADMLMKIADVLEVSILDFFTDEREKIE